MRVVTRKLSKGREGHLVLVNQMIRLIRTETNSPRGISPEEAQTNSTELARLTKRWNLGKRNQWRKQWKSQHKKWVRLRI